jgi:hypothetical protein
MSARMQRKMNTYTLFLGMQISAMAMESRKDVPQKNYKQTYHTSQECHSWAFLKGI